MVLFIIYGVLYLLHIRLSTDIKTTFLVYILIDFDRERRHRNQNPGRSLSICNRRQGIWNGLRNESAHLPLSRKSSPGRNDKLLIGRTQSWARFGHACGDGVL